jgi:formimidoylglutamate deiminase
MSELSLLRFAKAWLPDGWRHNVVIAVEASGDIVEITPDQESSTANFVDGAAIPGMPNVHSHAFQRAMAGLAEHGSSRSTASGDSFWSWRETMYEHAGRMSPDRLSAIAAQAYVDMLKSGYTSVCEFHYLHHDAAGQPYADPAAMSKALIEAAATSGIGLTLLPALYQNSDFGGAAPTLRQRQFVLETDSYLSMLRDLRDATFGSRQIEIGVAFHSLRAVPASAMRSVLEEERDSKVFHIHIAEQELEVQSALAVLRRRPIEWLLENARPDERWCLIHATHATPAEIAGVAAAQSVVGLCPSTEANLGDGIFPLQSWLAAGGAFAIGSDSQISISPTEELRWLEYQARLARQRRNVLAAGRECSSGVLLWRSACEAGARASGRRVGALSVGCRADIVVLDLNAPILVGRDGEDIIDTFVFAGAAGAVRDVICGGRWVVRDGRHLTEGAVAAGYKRALRDILT